MRPCQALTPPATMNKREDLISNFNSCSTQDAHKRELRLQFTADLGGKALLAWCDRECKLYLSRSIDEVS